MMTFEQAALLDPDNDPGEILRGEWVPAVRRGWRHGEVVGNTCVLLRSYAREHRGWIVSAGDPGSKLASNPDTLCGPDVGVIRAERFPTGKGVAGWLDGAPELAVEVAGDGQSGFNCATAELFE